MKTCRKCGEEKENDFFSKRERVCKKCKNEVSTKWKQENPDKVNEWKLSNIDKVSGYRRKWRLKNPEKEKESKVKYVLNNYDKVIKAIKKYNLKNPDIIKKINRKQVDKISESYIKGVLRKLGHTKEQIAQDPDLIALKYIEIKLKRKLKNENL